MEPDCQRSVLPYRVPYADTDQMAVVYYANYLVYFERVRNEILRDRGFTYKEMEARGLALPVVEAHVNYRGSARYDDLLHIHGWAEPVGRVRLRVRHEIYRDDELLADGYTIHACMDLARGRPTRLPPELTTAN